MADTGIEPTGAVAETPADFGTGDASVVRQYLTQIKIYDGAVKDWTDNVVKLFRRYRNKGMATDTTAENRGKRYALLWSTMQTELPALFTNAPVPVVERRWKDNDDVTAQIAGEILDRALVYTLDAAEFKPAIEAAVFDFLLAGRGVVWLRKEVEFGDEIPTPESGNDQGDETNGDNQQPQGLAPVREIRDEKLCIDAVSWDCFGYNLGRNWKEVYVVWRKLYMNRDQLIARFGADLGSKVELDYEPDSSKPNQDVQDHPHLYKLATVYEVWDKTAKSATWIALGYKDGPLDQKQDPLGLKDFFPCPRPIFSSMDTTSLVPLPDFDMWKDQADEVDILTTRIYRLIQSCQVRGVYDARFEEIGRMYEDGLETDLIPVDKWAEFAQGGAFKGAVDFAPIDQIIEAIGELMQAREQAKNDAAELNGIADILRGQNTGPEMSATEARISGQYGVLRLQDRQGETQRFCRDIVRMMGELIAEGFTPETLQAMTGYILPTPEQKMQAQALIQQDQAYKAYQAQQQQAQQAAQAQQAQQQPQGGPPVAQAA